MVREIRKRKQILIIIKRFTQGIEAVRNQTMNVIPEKRASGGILNTYSGASVKLGPKTLRT